MPNAVLVHGGFHGGWCWRNVAGPLRAKGWSVQTPTLTGVAERSHLASREIGLETHVLDVLNVIVAEELHDVVLCSHSAGGIVASSVADRLPGRIRHIIYLDAPPPSDGQSFFDAIGENSGMPQLLRDQAAREGDGWLVPPGPFFSAASLGVTDPTDAAWVDRRVTSHPLRPLSEKATISGALDHLPKTFIRAERLPVPSLNQLAITLEADPNWHVERWDAGHDLMITHPERVAALIEKVAK